MRLRNANKNERFRGRCRPHGHGTFSTLKVGGWWLVVVGGVWRLMAVAAGGWWRLVVGGHWQLAVGGPLGLSLRAVLNSKKQKTGLLKDSPATECQLLRQGNDVPLHVNSMPPLAHSSQCFTPKWILVGGSEHWKL